MAATQRGLLFSIIVSFFTIAAKSQTYSKSDSIQVAQYISQASVYFEKLSFDTALQFSQKAIDYSKKHNYLHGQAWSLIKKNDILIEKDELEEADKHTPALMKLGVQLRDSTIVGIAFLHKGQVRLYLDEIDSAIYYLEKALANRLEKVRISYTGLAYNELGFAWGRKDNEDKMTANCFKGLSIYEGLNDYVGCAMTLGNISTVYNKLGKKQKAIDYGKQSMVYREKAGDINKLALVCCNLSQVYLDVDKKEAEKYQQLCVKYAQQSGSTARMVNAYITSSLIANAQNRNDSAFAYELKAISILESTGYDKWMLATRYIAAAFYTEALKQDSSITLSYFNKSIRLSEELKSKSKLQVSYAYMSDFYLRKKNYEMAYRTYKKQILYKDSMAMSEQEQNVAELEAKYQTAKKDIEIERLNTDQRIKQLEIEKQKAIISGNKLEAQQKENEINLLQQQKLLSDLKLQQQEEELLKQSLQAKNKEQELQLVQKEKLINEKGLQNQKQLRNGIIAGVVLLLLLSAIAFSRYQLKKKLEQQAVMQEMRNNIASDLHDDVGASLSNINILNELTRRNAGNPEKVQEYLSKASDDIKQVSEGISDIVWNINPRYDNLEHLFIRMKRYASDILDGKNISYDIKFPEQTGDWKLEMDKRRDLYLLFKEAVNNLAKYSSAKNALIELSINDSQLQLKVEDDGVGFNPAIIAAGNGLQNMQQRAALLKGQLDLQTSPGKGTQLRLVMPV